MMINNSLNIGIQGIQDSIQGIQDSMQGMEGAARKIARGGADGPRGTAEGGNNMIEPILDLKLYKRSVEASAQVVKTADETLGTLLDLKA